MKKIDNMEVIKSGMRAIILLIIAGLSLAALVGEIDDTTGWWAAKFVIYKAIAIAGFWLVGKLHNHWRETDRWIQATEEETARADEAINPIGRKDVSE